MKQRWRDAGPGWVFVPVVVALVVVIWAMCASPVMATDRVQYWGTGVERWRPWVEVYFQPNDVDRALRIIGCETGWTGDPYAVNPSSGAAGLFQHMPRYWAERSARFGWGGWDIMSVDANVAVAAGLVYHDPMSWAHWVCKG